MHALPEHLDTDRLLTPPQRQEALLVLRRYLAESYASKHPLRLPEFQRQTVWYPRDALPDGLGNDATGRRSEGRHSDPTYGAAMEAIYGSAGVPVQIPTMRTVDHDVIVRLLAALPAHLEGPVTLAYVRANGYAGAAVRLRLSRGTVTRRCAEALDLLCGMLYGPRWQSPPAA